MPTLQLAVAKNRNKMTIAEKKSLLREFKYQRRLKERKSK